MMGVMPALPPPPSQERTILALLESTGRDDVPVRKTFVQQEQSKGHYVGGPLSRLVSNQDEHGLDLYLLLHAKASGGDWTVTLGAAVWARALGREANGTGLTAVSKAWNRLEKLELIRRSRNGQRAQVELLREDGSGESYSRPTTEDDRWLNLSHRYWLDGWHKRLTLPAKAMLLVSLSLRDGFVLPFPRVPEWYTISRNTAQRGMRELLDRGLLTKGERWVEEPLSDIGYRLEVRYTLQAPFGPHKARKATKPVPPVKKVRPRIVRRRPKSDSARPQAEVSEERPMT